MIETILPKIQHFRNCLFQLFRFRRNATIDLIDAIASSAAESVVKTSLSPLFRRTYCSITDVVDNLFRQEAETNPTKEQLQAEHLKITQLLTGRCSAPKKRGFTLFAVDCTAKPRIFSKKVADRTIVHAPNHVPGQKPITVGHEYSLVVFLPEEEMDRNAHWTWPLSIRRVQSHETGPQVGFEQIEMLLTQTAFHELCVSVADSAYCTIDGIVKTAPLPNLINVTRMRSNRILCRQPLSETGLKRKGRPKLYGKLFKTESPPEPDEEVQFEKISSAARRWTIRASRWRNLLMKGKRHQHMERYPFDVVRVQVFDDAGKLVFRKPLWIAITGQRREELTSKQAYESYFQRYDIEHCFRFNKQKLLLASSQTPDTRHEENLAWITTLSFAMLYESRHLASEVRYPWERRKITAIVKTPPPSQVQRDYKRIIQEIGTPAPIPKPRGKSKGRAKETVVPHRKDNIVIRKARPMAARC